MDVKLKFIFWLASVICLGLAAASPAMAARRGGLAPRVALEPLGLLLFVFPFMWDAAVQGF